MSRSWLALVLLAPALAVASTPPANLAASLARAADDLRRVAPSSGVHVVSLPDGETVWGRDPDTARILASNTKLFTTAAALDQLGPDYFWETPLLATGAVEGGVLVGDLAVVGSGDPSFSGRFHDGDNFAIFRRWAAALRETGVTSIRGDLVLVHGLFDDELVHPDWPRDQLDRWYEAPVDALSFSDNSVLARVWAGDRPGGAAVAEVRPALPILEVASTARSTAELRAHKLVIGRAPDSSRIEVRGRVWMRSEPIEKWVSVPDPVAWFGEALRAGLAEEGIAVEGQLRPSQYLGAGPWRTVAIHRTSILDVIAVVNKRSQNFWAESVLKTLGARSCGDGSFATGARAVVEALAGLGVQTKGLHLVDGSGMSRNNTATPRVVTSLLARMVAHPWGRELAASLAGAGEVDSSLEERLREAPYRGNVTAKTGTLSGVVALSGYAKARSGRLYAFSILCNRAQTGSARVAQDRIVRTLVDHG